MVVMWSDMLPKTHIMPKNLYESEKLLLALKMPYERYMCVRRGASYLGKNTRMQSTARSVNPPGTWR